MFRVDIYLICRSLSSLKKTGSAYLFPLDDYPDSYELTLLLATIFTLVVRAGKSGTS